MAPVLDSLIGRPIRTSGPNPATSKTAWVNWWPFRSRGVTVSDEEALSLSAFYRGVSLIASAVAGMPLHVFQEDNAGGKVGTKIKTPATRYLWLRPNPEMTRQSMWERLVADEVRGNAFIFVEKNGLGQPLALWWISRNRVRVGRDSRGRKVYEIDNELPMIDFKEGGEVVHIPNWGDSLIGYDPIQLAAQSVQLGLSAEEYATLAFDEGQVPPGIITTDQYLTPNQADELSARWEEKHGGLANMAKVAVLGSGAAFQQLSVDPEKLQLQGLRSFQVQEAARLLGVPPHLLSDVDRSTSWGSGIAEQGQAFVTYCLQPHIIRFEEAINDALLVRELTDQYVKFDTDGLLRGNALQRAQVHAMAWGRWETTDEIRADEDMGAYVDSGAPGAVLMQPLNMAPLDAFEGMKIGSQAGGSDNSQ